MVPVYADPVKGRFKVKAVGGELLKFSALRNAALGRAAA